MSGVLRDWYKDKHRSTSLSVRDSDMECTSTCASQCGVNEALEGRDASLTGFRGGLF